MTLHREWQEVLVDQNMIILESRPTLVRAKAIFYIKNAIGCRGNSHIRCFDREFGFDSHERNCSYSIIDSKHHVRYCLSFRDCCL